MKTTKTTRKTTAQKQDEMLAMARSYGGSMALTTASEVALARGLERRGLVQVSTVRAAAPTQFQLARGRDFRLSKDGASMVYVQHVMTAL